MVSAFKPGELVLELAALSRPDSSNTMEEEVDHWLPRKEQEKVDAIVDEQKYSVSLPRDRFTLFLLLRIRHNLVIF